MMKLRDNASGIKILGYLKDNMNFQLLDNRMYVV
jgi:hypothetical protein